MQQFGGRYGPKAGVAWAVILVGERQYLQKNKEAPFGESAISMGLWCKQLASSQIVLTALCSGRATLPAESHSPGTIHNQQITAFD